MDIFQIHSQIINEYKSYISSFLKIKDERIHKTVQDVFESESLWPDPMMHYNHSFEKCKCIKESFVDYQVIFDIIKLHELHVEMDEAVLEAYSYGYGSAQPINLKHDFYEVDYLAENDRIRFTIHPDVRKEILKRLLELNHKIHEEEVEKGLWEKEGSKEKKNKTAKSKDSEVGEEEVGYGGGVDQKM